MEEPRHTRTPHASQNRKNTWGERYPEQGGALTFVRSAASNFNRPSKYYSSVIKSSLKLLFSLSPTATPAAPAVTANETRHL